MIFVGQNIFDFRGWRSEWIYYPWMKRPCLPLQVQPRKYYLWNVLIIIAEPQIFFPLKITRYTVGISALLGIHGVMTTIVMSQHMNIFMQLYTAPPRPACPVVDLSWTGVFPCELGWRGSALAVLILSAVLITCYSLITACLVRWNPRKQWNSTTSGNQLYILLPQ